jgi:hypothetical protein
MLGLVLGLLIIIVIVGLWAVRGLRAQRAHAERAAGTPAGAGAASEPDGADP